MHKSDQTIRIIDFTGYNPSIKIKHYMYIVEFYVIISVIEMHFLVKWLRENLGVKGSDLELKFISVRRLSTGKLRLSRKS